MFLLFLAGISVSKPLNGLVGKKMYLDQIEEDTKNYTDHVDSDDDTEHVASDDETEHVAIDDNTEHVASDGETEDINSDDVTNYVAAQTAVLRKRSVGLSVNIGHLRIQPQLFTGTGLQLFANIG